MKEHGKAIADAVVQKGAFVFVCGDGAHMARDVQNTFVSILTQHGGFPEGAEAAEAKKYLEDMKRRQRYVADIWC
jgi:sulfite reductase alpha subunit-like flavoprotein